MAHGKQKQTERQVMGYTMIVIIIIIKPFSSIRLDTNTEHK